MMCPQSRVMPLSRVIPPYRVTRYLLITKRLYFVSNKPVDTAHPKEFVPIEHLGVDDELVYVPALRYSANGRACLSFEGLLQNVYS